MKIAMVDRETKVVKIFNGISHLRRFTVYALIPEIVENAVDEVVAFREVNGIMDAIKDIEDGYEKHIHNFFEDGVDLLVID